jgi:hypothetical protein
MSRPIPTITVRSQASAISCTGRPLTPPAGAARIRLTKRVAPRQVTDNSFDVTPFWVCQILDPRRAKTS